MQRCHTRSEQVRTGLRALGQVFGLKFNHEKVFEAVLAFGYPTLHREYRKLVLLPEGRRLLDDKPDLMAVLGDDSYLAALPPGSLGAAYRDFLRQHRLDAGVFSLHGVIEPAVERNGWDPDFGYMIARGTALHDMFHVLGGYGPDMGGELGNLGIPSRSARQLPDNGGLRADRETDDRRWVLAAQATVLDRSGTARTGRDKSDGRFDTRTCSIGRWPKSVPSWESHRRGRRIQAATSSPDGSYRSAINPRPTSHGTTRRQSPPPASGAASPDPQMGWRN